jgi:uncharacterized protein YyaL (SSP411 family)
MANRLVREASPYLLQHAANPVDWYAWGEEALEAARQQDKPIFLSIGYAACHWCHVMAHESFEDPAIAELMNEHFINIKVDREERPDLDTIYMQAVVSLTGQGGWPMSVFLTPDGEPFYGGTYFPPARRNQMPSFRELLIHVARLWQDDRAHLVQSAKHITEHLAPARPLESVGTERAAELLNQAMDWLLGAYDWAHGGWGAAPKFPQATTIEFLLARHQQAHDKLALEMATHALNAMASGGIYDHLVGGFHRYSVDAEWLVPHFEKMLYDSALLSRVYLHAWQITGAQEHREVAQQCLDFMIHHMRDPQGGLFSSIDADSEGVEGKYYLWTADEIRGALPDELMAEIFIAAYGVTRSGNFEGKNILRRVKGDDALAKQFEIPPPRIRSLLDDAKMILAERRVKRIPPAVDDKVLAGWNGLALIAMSEAARALEREDYREAAQDMADFLLEHHILAGRLKRSWRQGRARFSAYLEDQAALGLGLLALYQCDFEPRWYQGARHRANEILSHFSDPDGGFFDTRDDHEALISRPKSVQDSPMPSSSTLAVWLMLKMESLSGQPKYGRPAEQAVLAMASSAARQPTALAGWLISLLQIASPRLQLAIIGEPSSPEFKSLYSTVRSLYFPNLVIAGGPPNQCGQPELLAGRDRLGGEAGAYLCQSFACKLPTASPQELSEQMEEYL